jgi:hypothetical protein
MPLTLSKNQLYTIKVEIMQIVYLQTKKYFLYININNVIVFVKIKNASYLMGCDF